MSVPNQNIIRFSKRAEYDKDHLFFRAHHDATQLAMQLLKGESFKLWIYLIKFAEGHQLELSQKACENWGMKKDAYYTAKANLIKVGYLTPANEDSNILTFSEFPNGWTPPPSEKPKDDKKPISNSFGKTEQVVATNSEKPTNLIIDSEKPKTFSEKPNIISEKPKNPSVFPQRKTIKTIDTIDIQQEEFKSSNDDLNSSTPPKHDAEAPQAQLDALGCSYEVIYPGFVRIAQTNKVIKLIEG